jgi:hypothetical protein
MGGANMFDLSKSTADWLGDLKQSGAFEDSHLEELGSHLRDDIEQLMDKGLSEKEAFWVATSRVGTREELPEEYAKTNSRAVWRHRFLWMVVGILAFLVLNFLIGLLSYGTTLVAVLSGIDDDLAVMVSLSMQILLTCGALASAYFILSRDSFDLSSHYRKARRSRSRIVVFYAIPLALLGGLMSLWWGAAPIMLPRVTNYVALSTVWYSTAVGSSIFSVLFVAALAGIALVLRRPKKSEPRLSLER